MTNPSKMSPLIVGAFLASILYWLYLLCVCQMYLWHDAIGYEQLGRLLHQKGWVEYFRTGPNREPLYPWTIAWSMGLAERLGTSYKTVQMFLQVLVLLGTQALTYSLLRRLAVKPWLTALTLLYLGFSPAMFISTFRLYSEIAVYPFVLLILLAHLRTWTELRKDTGILRVGASGVLVGLALLGATFVKAVFQLVTPLFLGPYLVLTVLAVRRRYWPVLRRIIAVFLGILVGYYLPLTTYKWLNHRYNGKFALTDRGPWALYGNTARRMAPLTTRRFLMAMAYLPRPEGCYRLFGKEDCQVWHYSESDRLGFAKLHALRGKGLSPEEVDQRLIQAAVHKALSNPSQYALFWFLEGAKMFFWETSSMAYVVYPTWLVSVFYFPPFYLGLNALMALLSLTGAVYLGIHAWKKRREVFALDRCPSDPTALAFAVTTMVTAYIGAHGFFFVLPRYAFPMVPLYLISIAFMLQRGARS